MRILSDVTTDLDFSPIGSGAEFRKIDEAGHPRTPARKCSAPAAPLTLRGRASPRCRRTAAGYYAAATLTTFTTPAVGLVCNNRWYICFTTAYPSPTRSSRIDRSSMVM